MKLKFLLTTCLIFFISSVSLADVVHDESVDGDLSGDFSAPDQLMFLNGPNTIIGSMAETGNGGATDGSDADYFFFSVGALQQLSAITVDAWTFSPDDPPGPGLSFVGYTAGTSFTGQGAGDVDGLTLFDASSGDILDDLGGALGPGDYAFWLQETADGYVVDYQLTFEVSKVPEPAGGLLLAMMTLGFVGRRRR